MSEITSTPPAPATDDTPAAPPTDAAAALDAAQGRLQASTPEPEALPLATDVAQILSAPSDLVEKVVAVPEWGCSVQIRSLTAARSAKVRQAGVVGVGGNARIDFEALEKAQFLHGITAPKFSPEQVNVLYHQSGPGFQRVIKALDEISGTNPKAVKETLESFQAGGPEGQPGQ